MFFFSFSDVILIHKFAFTKQKIDILILLNLSYLPTLWEGPF